MSTKKPEKKEDIENKLEIVEQTLTKTEQYVENNQKKLSWVLVGILSIAAIYLGYKRFVLEPQESRAQEEIIYAQQYFEKDSFALALNGSDTELGFLEIADEYSSTDAGNLAHYYAGICALKTGDYELAIEQMNQYSASDEMSAPIAQGVIGDANMELGNQEAAYDAYVSAAELSDNSITAPFYLKKAGIAAEMTGEFAKALAHYEKIKQDFKKSNLASDIDKSIGRAKAKL